MPRLRHIALLALLALAALAARAQDIVSVRLPADLCAGTTRQLGFGTTPASNIQTYTPVSTLGHSERIFLPDGVPCGSMGCSYQSPVVFNAFQAGAVVTSVQDIKYVRLNIEHSFIGDIYINITCPNGQKADLMRKHTTGDNTQCSSTIPASSRGWRGPESQNTARGTFFGRANDNEASGQPCDSSAAGNAPGQGWNYCWSNNTTSGYQYAPGDAYIYRSASTHTHYLGGWGGYSFNSVDSSNVAAGSNFYHPDDNFSALVGCPLNGEWYIEVVDGYASDNGYIFEWELALDADLIPPTECHITGYSVIGPFISPGPADSLFILSVPDDLPADTSVQYLFRVFNSCGDTIDTTATIRLHPNRLTERDTTACDSFTFGAATYTASTQITSSLRTSHGCDSTALLNLTILHSSDTSLFLEVTQNELPYSFLGCTFSQADSCTHTAVNAQGCDSLIHIHLDVRFNHDYYVDTAICQSLLPFLWNGLTLTGSDTASFHGTDRFGADSIVHLTLTVWPEPHVEVELSCAESQLPFLYDHHLYYRSTDTTFFHLTSHGCDSTVHLLLSVLPTVVTLTDHHLCDVDTPFAVADTLFYSTDSLTLRLRAANGADSVSVIRVFVHPSFDTTRADTVCDNIAYFLGRTPLVASGHYDTTLRSRHDCDSTVHLDLTILPHNDTLWADTICPGFFSLLDTLPVRHTGLHTLRLTNTFGCDSILSLDLTVLDSNFYARIAASPTIVSPGATTVELRNASFHDADHLWLLGPDSSRAQHLTYSYPEDLDSVLVTLVAFSTDHCPDTARTLLRIDRSGIIAPNVFTPGADNNNRWQPVLRDALDIEVWIYNRQGNLVAHWQDPDASWDGRTPDGTPCPQAAYVYRIQYHTRIRPDRLQSLTGTLLLLR